MSGVAYLESSAIVKLVVEEPESTALRLALEGWEEWISCSIAYTEVVRACRLATPQGRRAGDKDALLTKAEAILNSIPLLTVDMAFLRRAAWLGPRELRVLDAVHLAAALSLGDDAGAIFTYEPGFARAANAHEFEVLSPA